MDKYTVILTCLLILGASRSAAQKQMPPGWPDRDPEADVLPGFINPPPGYGEVPFYWWQGDTLTRERIAWQLDQLADRGITSLQVNYSHLDHGGLTYGLSRPSRPALFSEEWWDLFRWFSDEAGKYDMTVSLSDYTLGVGQGFAMDEAIRDNPGLNGSLLRVSEEILTGRVTRKLPEHIISASAWKIRSDSTVIGGSRKDLMPYSKDGIVSVNLGKDKWKIVFISPERIIPSFDPMNPESGNAYNKYFFGRFEEKLPGGGSGRLNFFFSDELNFRLAGNLWNDSFSEEFRKRKGYDIVPLLDLLFLDGDPSAPRIRLDYNDVIVTLSEEYFFRPVYEWHQERGLIFGCDHGGRGRDVTEFGDYFRTQRWNQGPGSDQPRLSKDIIKAKVASSISHLYERPRVWLEGFHSSGWGTSSADVTDAIFANFTAGYNLLSFHGLYYTTLGGWWEWAPPDNHFRMPYWKHAEPLMDCVKRLSYLLSQGYHSCDVAIIYPTEPVVAEMDGDKAVGYAFNAGEVLYDNGIDFDFIDFESLARSVVADRELCVSGERYKVLVVPGMKAIRYSSLEKIRQFSDGGGIVVNIGPLPEATDRTGYDNNETTALVKGIFETRPNVVRCSNPEELPDAIRGKYLPGFRILSQITERPYVTHRIAGKRDIYALYNLPEGTRCFFNTTGSVQLWDPWNGRVSSLDEYSMKSGGGTEVTLPLASTEMQLIVFDHDYTSPAPEFKKKILKSEIDIDNDWEFDLRPCLDNRWGDYELPASNERLGAQVYELLFSEDTVYSGGIITAGKSWKRVTCGFGPQFLKLGPLPEMPSPGSILTERDVRAGSEFSLSGEKYKWEEYAFSWKQGVQGDYGHQGYHGLKGEMYDNFIRLGALEDDKMSLVRVPERPGNYYVLLTNVIAPEDGDYDILTGDIKPAVLYVNASSTDTAAGMIHLQKGSNQVMMIFEKACETFLVFRQPGIPEPAGQAVAMRWYRDDAVLHYDYPEGNHVSGFFSFESAPGLQELTFSAYGEVTAWVNGTKAGCNKLGSEADGLTQYVVRPVTYLPGTSQVVLRVDYRKGYRGAGAIPEYIKQVCKNGTISLGDWSLIDGLRSYSGGAWYRQTIETDSIGEGGEIIMDLGKVVSSAELFVNGKSAGIRVAPPWTYNITGYMEEGENDIEVLVYNTLANHYTSIPTRYRGNIRSGLIGPVRLLILQ